MSDHTQRTVNIRKWRFIPDIHQRARHCALMAKAGGPDRAHWERELTEAIGQIDYLQSQPRGEI